MEEEEREPRVQEPEVQELLKAKHLTCFVTYARIQEEKEQSPWDENGKRRLLSVVIGGLKLKVWHTWATMP